MPSTSLTSPTRPRSRGLFIRVCSVFVLSICIPPTPAVIAQPTVPLPAPDTVLTRIAFGSCAFEDRPQPIWPVIARNRPDLFLFLGDNVYIDKLDGRTRIPTTRAEFDADYRMLAEIPEFAAFAKTVPFLATWDDHDFGLNDAGAEFPHKQLAQEAFLDFFGVAADSPRRAREGVYHAETFGPPGQRVQIILLDTRYHRSPLLRSNGPRIPGRGRYMPDPDPTKTMLGDAQWQWLEDQLKQPADLRLICSSIQILAGEHRFESWINLAAERDRLFQLIADTKAAGVVFLTGDRHLAELSIAPPTQTPVGYPLHDLTASGLNETRRPVNEPNRYRHPNPQAVFRQTHYGLLLIDWDTDAQNPSPTVTLEVRDRLGNPLIQHAVPLATLQP
ncbi:MAG: alkaline phosphatase D family protein [Planctomycetota bacterium]